MNTFGHQGRRILLYKIFLVLGLVAIFIVDLSIPLGLIIWLSYIPLIFLAVFLKDRGFLRFLGFLSCGFIILAFFFDVSRVKELVPFWISVYHRMFGIIIILIIDHISCKLLETREIVGKLEKLIKVCAWTKRINVDGEWISLEEFMRRYLDKDVTHGISPEAYEKMLKESNVKHEGGVKGKQDLHDTENPARDQ